jgi:outer membrane protein assembly factor BamB
MSLSWTVVRRPVWAGLLFWFMVGLVGLDPPYAPGWFYASRILLAADWPHWGGRDGSNMVSDEKPLPATFEPGRKSPQGAGIDLATTRNVKWVARLGSQTYGTPTIAGGRIYVGTNDDGLGDKRLSPSGGGREMCFDEATGKLLWHLVVPRFDCQPRPVNFDDMSLGLCSSAAVESDRAWLVSNRCEVLCLGVNGLAHGNRGPFTDEGQYMAGPGRPPVALQPTDADILWRYDMIRELNVWPHDAVSSSPLVVGDVVYVCTSNGVDRGHTRLTSPLAPSLIGLDKKTGRLAAVDQEKIGTRLFHGQWSSPTLAVAGGRRLVLFGAGDGLVYAFEALDTVPREPVPLRKVWWFDCNPPEYKKFGGKKFTYLSGDVRKHQGNNNDGQFIGPSEIIATPVFYKNRVYVATGQDPAHGRGRGILCCMDATQTGDVTASGKVWTYDRIGRSLSTVAIADGLVYAADTFEGLHCLDADTGQRYWFQPSNSEIWGSPLVADGKVYLPTKKGLMVLAAGRQRKVLSEIHLGAPECCSPVAANGVLFVTSHRYLWAVSGGR